MNVWYRFNAAKSLCFRCKRFSSEWIDRVHSFRPLSSDTKSKNGDERQTNLPPSKRMYRPFTDEHEVILDYDEQIQEQELNRVEHMTRHRNRLSKVGKSKSIISSSLSESSFESEKQLNRVIFADDPVFDVPSLVEVLRAERLEDLLVIQVPQHLNYADYLILSTARNERHLRSSIQQVRREYKQRRVDPQPTLRPDPDQASDWQALDMRNIVLHVFTEATRVRYDVDSLWSVGPEFDELTQRPQQDASLSMLERHIRFLDGLQAAD